MSNDQFYIFKGIYKFTITRKAFNYSQQELYALKSAFLACFPKLKKKYALIITSLGTKKKTFNKIKIKKAFA